jgi:hypothetical protein
MENAINKHRILLLLVVWVIVAWPQAASALTYDIYLYRPADIAGKGISITVRETKSGTLQCKLTVDKKKMGSPIIGMELSSGTDHSVISMELRTHATDNSLVTYFTLSRDLLLHGQIVIGIDDKIPGGTLYHAAFVDFIDFGEELPASLQRRQARITELELQKMLPRYEDSTPMRGQAGDARVLLQGKTPIIPYKPSFD